MQAVPLEGRAAHVATLRAKLSIASLRSAPNNPNRAMRESEAIARDRYERELRALGEVI